MQVDPVNPYHSTDPKVQRILEVDNNLSNALLLLSTIFYGFVFINAIFIFYFVVFYKRRNDLFLCATPVCFLLIGFMMFFRNLGFYFS